MKRPLAYLTAAWSGEPDVDMELAAHYCRLAYEAGFSPICPLLYLPLFLNDSVPEEHKAGIDMRRDIGIWPIRIQACWWRTAFYAVCERQVHKG